MSFPSATCIRSDGFPVTPNSARGLTPSRTIPMQGASGVLHCAVSRKEHGHPQRPKNDGPNGSSNSPELENCRIRPDPGTRSIGCRRVNGTSSGRYAPMSARGVTRLPGRGSPTRMSSPWPDRWRLTLRPERLPTVSSFTAMTMPPAKRPGLRSGGRATRFHWPDGLPVLRHGARASLRWPARCSQ